MTDQRYADRLRFSVAKHHRQNLRQQIDPNLINYIEIDQNPSLNYMKVYKNLCQDQLQKTLQQHEQKRNKEKQFSSQDKSCYIQGMRQQRPPQDTINNMTLSQLSRIGQRFVDYDEQKNIKKQQHVIKNYDGGQAFFKAHDEHLRRKQHQAQVTNQTLQNQLKQKQYLRYADKMKKTEENKAFEEMKYYQYLDAQQKFSYQQTNKREFRDNIVRQMQQEKIKKQKKSVFQYDNIARHNPITNPIQYHIDNPYILKEIQNKVYKANTFHNTTNPNKYF